MLNMLQNSISNEWSQFDLVFAPTNSNIYEITVLNSLQRNLLLKFNASLCITISILNRTVQNIIESNHENKKGFVV